MSDFEANTETQTDTVEAVRLDDNIRQPSQPDQSLPIPAGAPLSPSASASNRQITVNVIFDSTLNFAMEQCGVPLVKSVKVTNLSTEPLNGLRFEIGLAPELGEPVRLAVPLLRGGEQVDLGVVDIRLPPGRLRGVLEAERVSLSWVLYGETGVLLNQQADVRLLAYNEWVAASTAPTLLATFVTPNHPVIMQVLKLVRGYLATSTDDNSLNGYQSCSPQRVTKMVEALYTTFQDLGISYINPPASFEQTGQKIRLADVVLSDQMGTCIDLSMLIASCLEQMGLNPLLVLVKGHTFIGVWLNDDYFPECVVEDASRLRNLQLSGDLLCFNSSSFASSPQPPFPQVIASAWEYLSDDEHFNYVIDVRQARRSGVRPLPIRMTIQAEAHPIANEAATSSARTILEAAASEPETTDSTPPPTSETVTLRFRRWKERLLDLSLRNRLVNFREGSSSIPLAIPDLARFEDLLAGNRVFDLLPQPPKDPRDQRAPELMQARESTEEVLKRYLADLERGLCYVPDSEATLLARAKLLDRNARIDREEGGVNTMFLAIGLLKWFESATSTNERYAPLLLVPVRIEFDLNLRRLRLRRSEDESLGNITLVEKMRRDFDVDLSALAALEADESGVDIPQMLRRVRQAITRMPRWEVIEKAHISLFTFAKFLMWRDLEDNASVLLTSAVVRHIAYGGIAVLRDAVGEVVPAQLDSELSPAQLPLVVDADSTQLSAIVAALRGRSFVLQGPPGTGKSQTITNLIAAAIAEGKSVLFVSEKMAALEVVHRRLQKVGLGDFCLELHSNKANKKQVAESLGKSLERTAASCSVPWEMRSREIGELRKGLNEYVHALHQRRSLGLSFYQANSQLIALKDTPQIRLNMVDILNLDEERWHSMLASVEALVTPAKAVEPIAHPWYESRCTEWNGTLEENARDQLELLLETIETVKTIASTLAGLLGAQAPSSLKGLEDLVALGTAVSGRPVPDVALDSEKWEILAQQAQTWIAARYEEDTQRRTLDTRWLNEFWMLDMQSVSEPFKKWQTSPLNFIFLFLPRRNLQKVARTNLPSNTQMITDLSLARQLQQLQPERDQQRECLESAFAGTWSGKPGDLVDLKDVIERTRLLKNALMPWGDETQRMVMNLVSPTVPEAQRDVVKTQTIALSQATSHMKATLLVLAQLVQTEASLPNISAANYLGDLDALLKPWHEEFKRFRSWCLYRKAAIVASSQGLNSLVEAHQQGQLIAEQLVAAFQRALLNRWTIAVRDSESVLRNFEGNAHTQALERFRELDTQHINLGRQQVQAQLDKRRLSVSTNVSANSEPGILQREVKKKTRHLPIRKLFQQVPNLLLRLKPCLLMSPLSIAQYLPAEGRRFDLVIFDEASQIGTHDAIGAIARGNQVVIVGDSKQLPPTSFFSRSSANEDTLPDDNDVVELESILDEAVAARFPQQMLGWHYRSRHETLIDFSNRYYYENCLNVFPAARAQVTDLGVKWNFIAGGVYEKGRSRTNPIEAQILVNWLVEALRKYAPETRSFGVITFSMAQQLLIQDLLDQARAEYPEIEGHFADGLVEPVFIKNLENVQGDERDEILFSICYEPDENGKILMNFGLLNRTGGERRLNVAVTRARCQLRVFSSLRPDQIDLSRTNSVGVRHLRAFLQYSVECGSSTEKTVARTDDFSSALERQVHDAVVALGYKVDCQVGCGGYRIDLAVLDPERPGEYLLGIECDGNNYAAGVTARDRDRLRQQVLESLGWRLYRIWSSDWWFERDQALEKLKNTLANAFEAVRMNADMSQFQLPPEASLLKETSVSSGILFPSETTNAPEAGL